MTKHEIVLNSLYYRLQDALDDSWKMYNDAREMKAYGELEMARATLDDARMRLNHSDVVRDRIESYKKKNDLNDSSEYFYCFILDKLDDLKMKVSKFSV